MVSFGRTLNVLSGGRFGQSAAEAKAEATASDVRASEVGKARAEKFSGYKFLSGKEKRKLRLKEFRKVKGEERIAKGIPARLSRIPKSRTAKKQRDFLSVYSLVGPTARGYRAPGVKSGVKYKKTGRKAGRPKGTFKYYIPGKGPVDIYTFRTWNKRRRALQRLQGPEPQPYSNNLPTQATVEPVQSTQPQPLPSTHNIFSESQGGPTGNILNAPNVFRGELKNVGANTVVQNVDHLHKPVANPSGDYYTDVDPMSGRPLLRRRISERWLTN